MAKSRKNARFQGIWLSLLLLPVGLFVWVHSAPRESVSLNVSMGNPDQLEALADSLADMDRPPAGGVEIQIAFRHYRAHPLQNPDSKSYEALNWLIEVCEEGQIPYGFNLALAPPAGLQAQHIRPGYLLTSLASLLIKHEAYPPAYMEFGDSWFESDQMTQMVETFTIECHQVKAFAGILITNGAGQKLCGPERAAWIQP